MLAFHGRGETDEDLETYSGLDRLPAIVAYPQGLPGIAGKSGWQGTPYAAPGADDIGFADAVIAHLQATLCVDATKIDATGKSDGGGLAALLACRSPEIDAIAVVSGAFYTALSTCLPRHGVAVLNFHGSDDTVIPYGGDTSRGLLSVPAWLTGWVTRDTCRQPATTFFDRDGVQAQRWSGCSHGATVENYRIEAGGHTWTGSTGDSGPGGNTTVVSATDLIGTFFAAH